MTSNEIYNYWLASKNVSEQLKQKMLTMSNDEIEVAFCDEPLKFGTAGYRAIYGPGPKYLNEHTYQQLTVAYAKYLIQNHENKAKPIRVFVGHDNRLDGKKISEMIAQILSSFNIEVYLIKNNWMVATPIVSYIVRDLKLDGAINITASHNPKEYNGFKAYNNTGAQVNEEQASIISNNLPNWLINLEKTYVANFNLIKFLDKPIFERYYASINEVINLTNYKNYHLPIIITTHHGAGSVYVQDYLESLGHNVIPVKEQCFEDPYFTNSSNMNPEEDISFKKAIEYAEHHNSEIAIGFDPDADRMAIAVKYKKRWYYLNGNEMGILATYYLITHKQMNNLIPIVVSTYVSNNLIDRICRHHNGVVLRTATGFKNIAQAMDCVDENEACYLIGFEEAVGMNISLKTREKDGIAASALALEMYNYYKQQNQSLIEILWYRIYQIYGQWFGKTISLKIPGTNWKLIAEQLQEKALNIPLNTKIGNFKIKEVNFNQEGNCIEWNLGNDSWIKFRISGTEPKFKIYFNLYFEQDDFVYDYDKYDNIVKKLTKIIEEKVLG